MYPYFYIVEKAEGRIMTWFIPYLKEKEYENKTDNN